MADIILRGRITEGKIELVDPLPSDVPDEKDVTIIIKQAPYQATNDFGDPVMIDEENGIIEPLEPISFDELVSSGFIGMWADRRDEISDSADWVRNLRQNETRKAWQNRKLS
jgi:hypothetical protein